MPAGLPAIRLSLIHIYAWAELKLYQGRADSDKDDAKDAGNAEQYTYYTAQEQTYKAAASSYYKMLDNMKKTASSTSTQRQTERQMTVAAQSLMVSYETLRQQKYTLEKMEELYKTCLLYTSRCV